MSHTVQTYSCCACTYVRVLHVFQSLLASKQGLRHFSVFLPRAAVAPCADGAGVRFILGALCPPLDTQLALGQLMQLAMKSI